MFTGGPVAGEKERPDMAKRKTHESHNSRESGSVSAAMSGLIFLHSIRALPAVVLSKLHSSHKLGAPCDVSRTLVPPTAAVIHDHND